MNEIEHQETEPAQATPDPIDGSLYEKLRPYLRSALEQVIQAGRPVNDFANFAIDKFGDQIIPYIQNFLKELRNGSIKLTDMTECAWVELFGTDIDRQEREQMIREAAYFRAQRRGFTGGDPNEDWVEAEREIDAELLADIGLLEKGRILATEFVTVIENEIGDATKTVCRWLNDHIVVHPAPH